MSELINLAVDPSTAVVLHSLNALQGPVVAGISDTINSQIATWTGVIRGGAGLAAIIIVIVTAVKSRLAIASTLLSVVVAAFLLWAVTGDGLGWFSNSIDQEINGSPLSSQVVKLEIL